MALIDGTRAFERPIALPTTSESTFASESESSPSLSPSASYESGSPYG